MVEVSVIGSESYSVMKQLRLVQGQALKVMKASWNASRKQLQHTTGTVLQVAPECTEQFEDASIPLGVFADVLTASPWTRVSVEGCVLCAGEAGNCRQDARSGQVFVRDATIYNTFSQGINLRIVHSEEDAMDFLQEGDHIVVKFGKVNGSSWIYADTTDPCQVEATGADSCLRPSPETVQPID